jgi:succinyl-CoA synthetase beta subunit
MARLHEYQGKALLHEQGIATPKGEVIRAVEDAEKAFNAIGGPVVMKVQAWTTSRKAKGGVVFAKTAAEATEHAKNLLGMTFGNFPVTEVLMEEMIDIKDEIFMSLTVDDAAQAPLLLLDTQGGSGIEDRAETVARLPVSPKLGVDKDSVAHVVGESKIDPALHEEVTRVICTLVDFAKLCEARSLEVNPLVTTGDGRVMAADCRMTIDDYAVFRHPELGIEIARELDHPPTDLERLAYEMEKNDHRGTFYFAQLPTAGAADSKRAHRLPRRGRRRAR